MNELPRNAEFYDEGTETTSEGGTFNVWSDEPKPKKRWWRRLRSSITGRFMSKKQYDVADPNTTQSTPVERKGGN